jgi:hypothetical protein
MTGKLIFAPIHRLPDNWWTDTPAADPDSVWTVWDKNSYYLWGANEGNYQQTPIGQLIGGGGMAGINGPSRGRSHPHYIGVNTMEFADMADNDAVFDDLNTKIRNGQNVVVPIYAQDKATPCMAQCSLGTGIGATVPHWSDIQKYIFGKFVELAQTAGTGNLVIPDGTYWPDCRKPEPHPRHMITSVEDMETIIATL